MSTKRTILLFTVALALALALVLTVALPQSSQAQNGNTWTLQFYSNPNWEGSPSLVYYSPYIDFNWGTVPPGPGMPAENLDGYHDVERLLLCGYLHLQRASRRRGLAANRRHHVHQYHRCGDVRQARGGGGSAGGRHALACRAISAIYRYGLCLPDLGVWQWRDDLSPPAAGLLSQPIATPAATPAACDPDWSCTCPTQATTVTTVYGDYTSCIEQNLHQSQCYVSNGAWDAPN